jgi:hypothetical protein
MTIDDLKSEYLKTKSEGNDYKRFLDEGKFVRDLKGIDHILKKIEMKKRLIKQIINQWLNKARINEVNDTIDAFDKLFKQRRTLDHNPRMKTLYSYDITDNHLFKKT